MQIGSTVASHRVDYRLALCGATRRCGDGCRMSSPKPMSTSRPEVYPGLPLPLPEIVCAPPTVGGSVQTAGVTPVASYITTIARMALMPKAAESTPWTMPAVVARAQTREA